MINLKVFVDPGVNSSGLVVFVNDTCELSKTIITKKSDRPNQAVRMADNIVKELEQLLLTAAPTEAYEMDLIYEEPNLSGRFLSRSQRTMDTFIGALQGLLYYRFDCRSFSPVHPMTLKSFYKAAKTDKLDMALKAGQFLEPAAQERLSKAILDEEFDVTDAFSLAARYYAQSMGLQYAEEPSA